MITSFHYSCITLRVIHPYRDLHGNAVRRQTFPVCRLAHVQHLQQVEGKSQRVILIQVGVTETSFLTLARPRLRDVLPIGLEEGDSHEGAARTEGIAPNAYTRVSNGGLNAADTVRKLRQFGS